MAKVFDRFLNALGFEVVEEEDELEDLTPTVKDDKEELSWYEKKLAKRQERKQERRSELTTVPNINNNVHGTRMIVSHLSSFDGASQVADHLRDNNSVVIDLTELSLEQAQRVLDYLSGVVFAIEGNASRVGSGIFLFTPPNVSIEGAVELFMNGNDEKDENEEAHSGEKINSILKSVGA